MYWEELVTNTYNRLCGYMEAGNILAFENCLENIESCLSITPPASDEFKAMLKAHDESMKRDMNQKVTQATNDGLDEDGVKAVVKFYGDERRQQYYQEVIKDTQRIIRKYNLFYEYQPWNRPAYVKPKVKLTLPSESVTPTPPPTIVKSEQSTEPVEEKPKRFRFRK